MISSLRSAFARFRTVFMGDLSYHARRPLFIDLGSASLPSRPGDFRAGR